MAKNLETENTKSVSELYILPNKGHNVWVKKIRDFKKGEEKSGWEKRGKKREKRGKKGEKEGILITTMYVYIKHSGNIKQNDHNFF